MTNLHDTFLGLDLGTSGLRALLVNAAGDPISSAQSDYAVSNPQPGWSEQDPTNWIKACEAVIAELTANVPEELANLRAIGVAGHMHGAVFLDGDGAVLRPCILWNDTRSHAEATQLDQQPPFRELSGNIVFSGFTAPKLTWVQENEPEIYRQIDTVLLPKDYLNFWLTGHLATDKSDASGTSWMDVKKRDWSNDLLERSGATHAMMPEALEGTDIVGVLSPARQTELNLNHSVKVVAGAADNAAAACGIGAISDGHGFISLGTSGVVLASQSKCKPAPETAVHTFCHAIPDKWYQMGVILAATDCQNWLANMLERSPEHLAALMPDQLRPPSHTTFLPYLSGERTPHNDSDIRGAFLGLSKDTDRAAMVQATFEGVAFALRDCFDALKAAGTQLDSAFAIGGGAQSEYWLKIIATVLDIDLNIPEGREFGAALGAARVAICGATGASPTQVMTPPKIAKTISPNVALRPQFENAYQRYKPLYSALKDVQT